MKKILWRGFKDFALYGMLLGLFVAPIVAGVLVLIARLFHLASPSYLNWAVLGYVIIAAFVFLDSIGVTIERYLGSVRLAKKWEVPHEQVVDAIANFDLGKYAKKSWQRHDFILWYKVKKAGAQTAEVLGKGRVRF